MGEIGVEMCQAEVGHHANRCPEYLISREIKNVALYKKSLALNTSRSAKQQKDEQCGDEEDGPQGESEAEAKRCTKPSDVDLYEQRSLYWFWPRDTPISPHLPSKATPEEQVIAASLWDFFRLVKFKGGCQPHFEWHDPIACPIVNNTHTHAVAALQHKEAKFYAGPVHPHQ